MSSTVKYALILIIISASALLFLYLKKPEPEITVKDTPVPETVYPHPQSSPPSSESGKNMAPNFELESLDGEVVKLSDFRGKIVLLDFWATWCGPCKVQMKKLKELKSLVNEDEVVIISIDVGESKSIVQEFISKEEVDWLVLLDLRGFTAKSYGIRAIPTLFIIDKEGLIREKYVGVTSTQTLLSAIEALISG